jgi:hypothetical protein
MQHLSRLLLKAVIQGELPVGLVTRIAMEHMLNLCPECRHEYDLMKAALAARVKTPQPQVLSLVLTSHVEDLRSRTRGAKRDFAKLMKLPVEERAGRIARARHRFRGPHLVHLLLVTLLPSPKGYGRCESPVLCFTSSMCGLPLPVCRQARTPGRIPAPTTAGRSTPTDSRKRLEPAARRGEGLSAIESPA